MGREYRFECNNGKWFLNGQPVAACPLQVSKDVPKIVAEEGYKEYAAQYGTSQSLDRLSERGGFAGSELAILLFERIKRLEREMAKE